MYGDSSLQASDKDMAGRYLAIVATLRALALALVSELLNVTRLECSDCSALSRAPTDKKKTPRIALKQAENLTPLIVIKDL